MTENVGVVADATINRIEPVGKVEEVKPVYPGIASDYIEPPSLQALALEYAAACKLCAVPQADAADVLRLAQCGQAVLQRLKAVTEMALPFAIHATHLANMKMCLIGAGRPTEPSGGFWINGVNGGQLTANENAFFNMIDALGRGYVENHIMELFKAAQAKQALAVERDAHVEQGGKVQ